MKTMRTFFCGLLVGVFLTGSGAAFGAALVSAELASDVVYYFNGRYIPMPAGYNSLLFGNRLYVPARFVSEMLGATVEWDATRRSVKITAATPVPDPTPVPIPTPTPVPNPSIVYQPLPLTKVYADKEVSITYLHATDPTLPVASIGVKFKNKEDIPLMIEQFATTVTDAQGKVYRLSTKNSGYIDTRWYTDIRKDEEIEGRLSLDVLPANAKELQVKIVVIQNDANQKKEEIEFNVRLD